MHLQPQGPEKHRRFALVHQGRTWNGRRWQKKCRKPLLFRDADAAVAAWPQLVAALQEHEVVTFFSIPLEIQVRSSFAFDVDAMLKFLETRVGYTFEGMDGSPEGCVDAALHLNWASVDVHQQGPWPDPATTRPVSVEVPVRFYLLARSGSLDEGQVLHWLEQHCTVKVDELIPFADLPVALAHAVIQWKKAKVADVRSK